MSLLSRHVLFSYFNPLVQARRFRGKINLRRPQVPHLERAKFLELTKPYFISKYKDIPKVELCRNYRQNKKDEGENPLRDIIANELRRRFETSKMIAFYHCNPMKSDDKNKAYLMFFKENMLFKNFGRQIMKQAVEGTKHETILDFYVSNNMTVFSPELNLKPLLKITKRFPQLILMATICEGQLLSKDRTMQLSLVPNLQAAQMQLVQILDSAGVLLHSQLNTHQQQLVANLEARCKQLEEDKKEPTDV